MRRFAYIALALAGFAGAAGAAGCGSKGGASATTTVRPVIGGAEVGKTTNCLIDAEWLLQPGDNNIVGTSDKGVNFRISFYGSSAEARHHAGKKKVVLGNTVVDYGYDSGQAIGVGQGSGKPTTETAVIKRCLRSG
jgi:hypothetical protein